MDKDQLLNFIKKYDVMPEKVFMFDNGKLVVKYGLFNGSYSSELIAQKAKEEFGLDYEKFAYEAYCLLNIKYSQKNEFFID